MMRAKRLGLWMRVVSVRLLGAFGWPAVAHSAAEG